MKNLPISAKAAILTKNNSHLVVKNINFPKKLSKGQVLVKIFYSGVCRSQLMEVMGKRDNKKWIPHLLGHEATGEVLKIGRGVKNVKRGDNVILTWIKTLGIKSKNPQYKLGNLKINSGPVTTFSNYSIVSENRLIGMPRNLDKKRGVLLGCAFPTGAGMILNEKKFKNKNISVIIIGLGGVGLSALITLKYLKIKKVIIVDSSNQKLNFAKRLGFKKTFNSKNRNLKKKIKEIFKNGADMCIEAAGTSKTIEMGFSLINNKNGKLIFASHPPIKERIKLNPHELISGKVIEGSWGGQYNPSKDILKLTKIINKNKSYLNKLISKEYTLEKVNAALDDLKKGRAFRPIIRMKH